MFLKIIFLCGLIFTLPELFLLATGFTLRNSFAIKVTKTLYISVLSIST